VLRRAVVVRLRTEVGGLGGRVYQALLGPADAERPYATVKLPEAVGSGRLGTQPVEVRLYGDPTTFSALDALGEAVVDALDDATLADATDGRTYYLQVASPAGSDFQDEQKRLIGRLMRFEAAAVAEGV
jgi:hypothetical protein